ncbi:MAG TPA: GIY-YIG nuclease family protein [Anaerolineaceae bacterium]|nr:GIY-YIG nuclease family protein [Anaerolineaceae bacterium]HPN52465.1 GIY-YIG nuclease family protein [Anaerolineaceae bacterium]
MARVKNRRSRRTPTRRRAVEDQTVVADAGAEQTPEVEKPGQPYFCYLVRCADGSFYAGISTDPERRARQHNAGRGARYTRMHRPVTLVYVEPQPDVAAALRRERAIKKLSHAMKEKLAAAAPEFLEK